MDEESALYVLQKVIPHFVSIATEEAKTLPDEDGRYRKERNGGRWREGDRFVYLSTCLFSLSALIFLSSLLPPPTQSFQYGSGQ